VQRRRRFDRSVTDDLANEILEQLVWCGMRVECGRATRVMHRLAVAAQGCRGLRVPIDPRARSDLVIGRARWRLLWDLPGREYGFDAMLERIAELLRRRG
jgi:hypothetical protein